MVGHHCWAVLWLKGGAAVVHAGAVLIAQLGATGRCVQLGAFLSVS